MDKNDQLDEEFRLGLASIRRYLGNLSSEDAKLCHSWLNKLYDSVHERPLRNKLLKDLIGCVKSGHLEYPFIIPPKQNCLPVFEAGGEGQHVKGCRSDSSFTIFSPSENFTEKNARQEGYETTDESQAVFPLMMKNKRKTGPFTLTRWRETSDVLIPENEELNSDEEHALRNTIATLRAQNDALSHEVMLYQQGAETNHNEVYKLNQEVISLRAKLSELQRLNSEIERRHVVAITDQKQALTDSLLQVSERLKGVNKQNDVLLNNVASLEHKLTLLNSQSEDSERKLKSEIDLLKSQLAKERQRHQAEILGFQNVLKQKNEQLKKVDCHVKMKCNRMQDEVTNIKHEMDQVTNETNVQLKAKVAVLKKDITKLEKANKKLISEYESRLHSSKREYQMRIGRLTAQTNKKFENSFELEKIVIDLEKKYKKLLSDLEQRAAVQRRRDSEKIQQLEQELLKYKKKNSFP